jgi:predicted transcriptional regulator
MNLLDTKPKTESKLLKLALSNKQIAIAVLGQALLEEGGIGAQSITVYYTSQDEAIHLWQIANSLGYANPLTKKKHRNHYHYGFSIIASKRKEIYKQIGPLPNPTKDKVFKHLANRKNRPSGRKKGEIKQSILQSISNQPKTVLELMFEFDLGASATRRHLEGLLKDGLVRIEGKNTTAFQKSRRTSNLWKAVRRTA